MIRIELPPSRGIACVVPVAVGEAVFGQSEVGERVGDEALGGGIGEDRRIEETDGEVVVPVEVEGRNCGRFGEVRGITDTARGHTGSGQIASHAHGGRYGEHATV